MAFVPALIPLGVSLARIQRNASDDGPNKAGKADKGRAIVDKITKGGAGAPITEWSEAKLEKAIRRNSVFRDHANELRLARVSGLLAAVTSSEAEVAQKGKAAVMRSETEVAQAKSSIAPVGDGPKAEVEETIIPDTSCQADLLLLAADAESQANPIRDAALELLADNSFDATLITDTNGIIAYSNKAFTKLTGYEQADVIGKSPKLLQGPDTDKKVLSRLHESMQKGDGDYEGSAINYRKNGTPFIMHWRVVPVKVGGEIKAWVAIQREGSEVK